MMTAFELTEPELQVLREVVFGFTDREIAARLRLSEEVVRHHLTLIFDKTGVSTRLELAKFMLKHGGPPFELTDLQLQIVREVVVFQLPNREIAAKLGIGEDEVQQHISNIFDKTGTCCRLELLQLFRDKLP
jgi:DNA-binding NarL/FixJ family response regulator